MDKLKPIIKAIKKYHVWVLCLVLIGTAVSGLFAASGGLKKNSESTKQEVTKLNDRATRLTVNQRPHNQLWVDQKVEEIDKESKRLRRMWDGIYDYRQGKVQWPEAVGGMAFAATIEEQASKARLDKPQEEKFEKYAAGAFDTMLGIVKAEANYAGRDDTPEKKADPRTGKPVKAVSLPPVRAGFLVGWAPASQREISTPLLRWGNEINYGAPTTARATQTQRDLWVYETMLKAIAATNADATANYMARVKYIRDLQIGNKVVSLTSPKVSVPRNSFSGIETIPVRMDLIVDQRYLSRLFSECANAPLPIEITGFTAHYRSRSGKDHFDQQKTEPKMLHPGQVEKKQDGPVGTVVDTYDMNVSIEGQVHFYKPPDDATLGVSQSSP